MSHILYMDVSFFVLIFRAIRPNLLSIIIYFLNLLSCFWIGYIPMIFMF